MTAILNVDFWTYVFVIAGIYAVFAVGLQVQYGEAGLINLGHVAFMSLAANTMAILVVKFAVPMILASVAGIGVAMLFALLLGVTALRLRTDYLSMVTIAASQILQYLMLNLQSVTGGPQGSAGLLGPATLAQYNTEWQSFQKSLQQAMTGILGNGVTPDMAMLVVVWVVVAAAVSVVWLLARSPWGRVVRSIREDEDAAEALGKDTFRYKLQVLLLGAALAGLSGLLLAWELTVFTPYDFLPIVTFYGYIIVIVGGMTNVRAVPIGAILFGVLFAATRFLNVYPLSELGSGQRAYLRLFLVGLLLLLLMVRRPQGVLGKREELVLEK
jgi:branched-chain amino acid transport system permease protein